MSQSCQVLSANSIIMLRLQKWKHFYQNSNDCEIKSLLYLSAEDLSPMPRCRQDHQYLIFKLGTLEVKAKSQVKVARAANWYI